MVIETLSTMLDFQKAKKTPLAWFLTYSSYFYINYSLKKVQAYKDGPDRIF